MHIISGKYKGRKIDGFDIIGTRPTMDRVKESMIAMIQNYIEDSVCLDLFAGSGSIGLELLSNGAKKCFFVDNNIKVIEILRKNINNIKIEEDVRLVKEDFKTFLTKFKNENQKIDIVFLDPPYDNNYINPSLALIEQNNLLNENGIVICEYTTEKINILDFKILKQKKYGIKNIMILKKNVD